MQYNILYEIQYSILSEIQYNILYEIQSEPQTQAGPLLPSPPILCHILTLTSNINNSVIY